MNNIINVTQFLFILTLLIYIVDLKDKNKRLESKEVELIDEYLDLQTDNVNSIEYTNSLEDEIKILSSCCANGSLTAKDSEYGD